ncbi:MAG: tetratricopeptide repeat protein, partial [Alphaproteobacteria bacterium]
MNSNAQAGSENPTPNSPAGQATGGRDAREPARETERPASNDPAAEALLRRFLSEVNGYRQAGNAALRELENRLTALSRHNPGVAARKKQSAAAASTSASAAASAAPASAPATSASPHPAAAPMPTSASSASASTSASASAARKPRTAPQRSANVKPNERTLTERLRELTNHLHDDISKNGVSGSEDPREMPGASMRHTMSAKRPSNFKSTPSSPVLDRAWFEDRFAAMRASIHHATDSFPLRRLESLEVQFAQLMERLDQRETAEDGIGQVQANLKRLAVYLQDSKVWAVSHDKRLSCVEAKLSHLSGLVEQSHAAIAATAKGLEIVAKGTGTRLAHATADLVVNQLENKIAHMNPVRAIEDLHQGVASLSMQSRQYARSTDERFRQLQTSLNDNFKRQAAEVAARRAKGSASGKTLDLQQDETKQYAPENHNENYEGDNCVRKLNTPARRASKLADGAQQKSTSKSEEPLRYQIPYGEFLPDEERKPSNVGLVIAAVILILASAAMLYLNLRDKNVLGKWPFDALPKFALSNPFSDSPAKVSHKTKGGGETTETKRSSRLISAGVKQARVMAMPSGIMLSSDNVLNSQQRNTQAVLIPAPSPSKNASAPKDTPSASETTKKAEKEASVSKAAIKGDMDAQFHVGQKYLNSDDVASTDEKQKRLARAMRWFRRAAESGHVPSQYRLATMYELGRGAPQNYVEASKWYLRAAKRGHVKAMHNLAVLKAQGQDGPLDHTAAAKWFKQAADHGLADSQYNLAVLYERGIGVEKDTVKAYQWYALA